MICAGIRPNSLFATFDNADGPLSTMTQKQEPASGDFDPHRRIAELEAQVSKLTGAVWTLRQGELQASERLDSHQAGTPRSTLAHGVRQGVGRALGGEEGESIETRIGGIWLSRIAAVLAMTALVLGGAATVRDQEYAAVNKIALGYALGLMALGYSLWKRENRELATRTLLGSGLAILYFTTDAGFFIESATVFHNEAAALPILGGCLLVLATVCYYLRSETSACISLFIIYYTVTLSLNEGEGQQSLYYALLTCSVVSTLALLFHFTYRWLFFTWAALVAAHLTFFFFWVNPATYGLPDDRYFWVAKGFITVTFLALSLVSVTDVRKTPDYRRIVGLLALANSALYLGVAWPGIRDWYPEYESVFLFSLAGAFALFAAISELTGPKRNYLSQMFIAKSAVVAMLALQAALSHEWLLVALSLEALGLCILYKRSGTLIFKVVGLLLAGAAFAGCIWYANDSQPVTFGDYALPANWFSSVAVALAFSLTAWLYEHMAQRKSADPPQTKSPWLLPSSIIDLRSQTLSLLYGAGASLLIAAITIVELGDYPSLPFILALESLVFATLGFLLRTSQVEVASVFLLIVAHVSYHIMAQYRGLEFEAQANLNLNTLLLALFTLFSGYLWERYLRRIKGGQPWEHEALASIPFLAATFMLTHLMTGNFDAPRIAVAQTLIGAALMLAAAATSYYYLRLAGLLALTIGSVTYFDSLYSLTGTTVDHPEFLFFLAISLGALVAAERFAAIHASKSAPETSHLRAALIGLASLQGVLALSEWAPGGQLTFYLLGLAVGWMAIGVVFRESRYRWASLAVYLVAIIRAYYADLGDPSSWIQPASFAALGVPLLVISWGYSRHRTHHLETLRTNQNDEPASQR